MCKTNKTYTANISLAITELNKQLGATKQPFMTNILLVVKHTKI